MPVLLDRFITEGDTQPHSAVLLRAVPAGFSATLKAAFERSASFAGETLDRHFNLGGHSLCLRFAGNPLIPILTPAIAHLAAAADSAAFTVHVWDASADASSIPLPACATDPTNACPDLLISIEAGAREAFYCVRDRASLPVWERGAPMRPLLHWWMASRGLHLMHAAAVGLPEGGVLLGGASGSGKSTSALACLRSNLSYAGDDYVLVGAEPEPVVHSLYRSAKLHADHTHRLPHLIPLIRNNDRTHTEKALMIMDEGYARNLTRGFPLRAILMPRVAGTPDTSVRPMRPSAVLRAMAPSTLFQLPGVGAETFQAIADLTRRLPCFQLDLGTDLSQIPLVISQVLRDAA